MKKLFLTTMVITMVLALLQAAVPAFASASAVTVPGGEFETKVIYSNTFNGMGAAPNTFPNGESDTGDLGWSVTYPNNEYALITPTKEVSPENEDVTNVYANEYLTVDGTSVGSTSFAKTGYAEFSYDIMYQGDIAEGEGFRFGIGYNGGGWDVEGDLASFAYSPNSDVLIKNANANGTVDTIDKDKWYTVRLTFNFDTGDINAYMTEEGQSESLLWFTKAMTLATQTNRLIQRYYPWARFTNGITEASNPTVCVRNMVVKEEYKVLDMILPAGDYFLDEGITVEYPLPEDYKTAKLYVNNILCETLDSVQYPGGAAYKTTIDISGFDYWGASVPVEFSILMNDGTVQSLTKTTTLQKRVKGQEYTIAHSDSGSVPLPVIADGNNTVGGRNALILSYDAETFEDDFEDGSVLKADYQRLAAGQTSPVNARFRLGTARQPIGSGMEIEFDFYSTSSNLLLGFYSPNNRVDLSAVNATFPKADGGQSGNGHVWMLLGNTPGRAIEAWQKIKFRIDGETQTCYTYIDGKLVYQVRRDTEGFDNDWRLKVASNIVNDNPLYGYFRNIKINTYYTLPGVAESQNAVDDGGDFTVTLSGLKNVRSILNTFDVYTGYLSDSATESMKLIVDGVEDEGATIIYDGLGSTNKTNTITVTPSAYPTNKKGYIVIEQTTDVVTNAKNGIQPLGEYNLDLMIPVYFTDNGIYYGDLETGVDNQAMDISMRLIAPADTLVGTLIASVYNGQQLEDIKLFEIEIDEEEGFDSVLRKRFTFGSEFERVMAALWDSIDGMKPLLSAVKR